MHVRFILRFYEVADTHTHTHTHTHPPSTDFDNLDEMSKSACTQRPRSWDDVVQVVRPAHARRTYVLLTTCRTPATHQIAQAALQCPEEEVGLRECPHLGNSLCIPKMKQHKRQMRVLTLYWGHQNEKSNAANHYDAWCQHHGHSRLLATKNNKKTTDTNHTPCE